MSAVQPSAVYVAVLAVLLTGAALAARAAGLRVSRDLLLAGMRAAVQLAAVSLVVAWVLRTWGATAAFVAVMAGVAAVTAARRIGAAPGRGWAGTAIAAGAGPVLALVLVSGAVPASPVAVLPVAGILIGGSMTATGLAGRRAMDELRSRRGEYEAMLALGLEAREALRLVCRPGVVQALFPALDQTRTVGLVTLPGAFVGVLLGGGGAVQAGAAQLLVLVGLLAAETSAVIVVVELIAHGLIRPAGGLPR